MEPIMTVTRETDLLLLIVLCLSLIVKRCNRG
jgi:hypothetical protein